MKKLILIVLNKSINCIVMIHVSSSLVFRVPVRLQLSTAAYSLPHNKTVLLTLWSKVLRNLREAQLLKTILAVFLNPIFQYHIHTSPLADLNTSQSSFEVKRNQT
jgi:Fe2+ transport system protein B